MKRIISILLFICFMVLTHAQYTETMDPDGLTKNLVTDYGVKSNQPDLNQSSEVQAAIDNLESLGGGRLIIPKGEYQFAEVNLKSDIHILVEDGTILRPYWPSGVKTNVFTFGQVFSKKDPSAYIQNVSIRGIDGRFIVDYSDHTREDNEGCRAINISMIKNFLIKDMDVKDNYTTYCGMVLSPVKEKDSHTVEEAKTWEVSRPTNGIIKDCRHFKASPGYGLVQLHGAQDVHFENLYSLGGVAMRLETGANTAHIGVYDITGKNIYCEDGRSALMLGPHSSKNGIVVVDNIVTKGCTYTVDIGQAGVKEDAPDQTPGYFTAGTKVSNVHAIFGKNAQIKNQVILEVPVEYYNDLKLWPDNKFLSGPSIGAVCDHSELYDVIIENVTMEGFKYNNDHKILTAEDVREGDKWDEWDKWKADYLDDDHRTQHAAVVIDYEIPNATFNESPISYEDNPWTSIGSENSLNNLKLYPNPANNYLVLESPYNIHRVQIYGLEGKLIQTTNIYGDQFNIPLEGVNPGTYIVQAHLSNKQFAKVLFVKK